MLVVVVGQPTHALAPLASELSAYDPEWKVRGAVDEQSAMEAVARESADVVVTGMHGGCGPALFNLLRTRHPDVTRLLLLDKNEEPAPLNAIESAHRLLNRPLHVEELIDSVESIIELRELLDSEQVKSVVGQISHLPAPPRLYVELTRAIDDPDSTPTQIANLVAQDPAVAAKVLRLCNSAYFCGGRTVTDLRSAVVRLGLQTLRRLVLATEVFAAGQETPERAEIRQRALLASQLAGRLLGGPSAELASTAALLCEVGRLVPGTTTTGTGGLHYADVGAYLLGLWGLPMAIVEGVANHHQPQRSRTRGFWVSGAVHVARALAADEPLDEDYLASVAVLDRLPRWRKMADDLLAAA